ncbi:MAG: amino acid adenylation domain-containing protein [bacterium]
MSNVSTPVDGADDVYVLPASFAQGRLWFLQQLEPDSAAYNIDVAFRLLGDLRIDALEAACVALISRHEILRTTLGQEGSEPIQVVHPSPVHFPLVVESLADAAPDEREQRLRTLIRDIGRSPFDLERGPLLRITVAQFSAEEHVVIASMHHVVSDGWSLGIFMRELGALYSAALALPEHRWDADSLVGAASLEPLPIQYADYALWQREWLSGEEMERQESFWRAQLGGQLPTLELPTDRPRPPVQGYSGATYRFELPADVSRELHALGRTDSATLFMTLLAAYGVFLHRYTNDEDFVIGSPIAGRTRSETEGLIGMFVNTLALRVDLSGEPTFRDVLGRVRHMLLDAYAHQEFPFDRLVHMLQPARDRRRSPLFQTMLDVQNAREASGQAGGSFAGLKSSRVPAPAITSKFDLQLSFSEGDNGLRGIVIYSTDLFDEATIARMMKHFRILVTGIVANPDAKVSRLPLLPSAERELVLRRWNATSVSYPSSATLVSLLEAQAQMTPDAIAVELASGTTEKRDGDTTLTFAECHSRATILARALVYRGVKPGALVGVCMERSLEMVVALVAVLKAGGAYVPLDPEYPADRLAFMIADARCPVLLTQQRVADTVLGALPLDEDAPAVNLLSVDADWNAIVLDAAKLSEPLPEVKPDDLAYMIYTSGSTGKPKGALNRHRGIVNRLLWMQNEYTLTADDAVLQKTPFSFDVSVWEFFLPLMSGARLVMAEPGGHRDPAYLADAIDAQQITVMHFVPSMLRAFLEEPTAADCGATLRDVMCSGEALPYDLQQRFFSIIRGDTHNVGLHNLYGPTECAVDVSYWACIRNDTRHTVPIGRPVANTQLYVLDAAMEPVPIGVAGELYLGGVQVGAGYWGRDDLTHDRFVPDPFVSEPTADVDGARLYKTGDLARWLPDGVVEYLGRLDFQVKLRGFRIELGEIESAISAYEGVREAAVVVRTDAAGEQRLIGYYVAQEGAKLVGADITAALRAQLPSHMVPSALVPLDALPLSPSGKLDRRGLPEPELFGDDNARPYKAPRSNVEHELVQIWEQLLPGRKISIYDDFFEIGGHSLLAVQMLAEVERMRGRRVPLAWLFESATVETLAARLSAQVQAEREPPLVVLQPEATGKPMAFVHGDVRGGGWYGRRLAPLAAPHSPIYLLGTVGIDNEVRPWTIEEMARIHIAELRKMQPHGPYRVGGFCVGGIVAFEMAVQLQRAGERIERLVIVDSAAVNVHVRGAKPLLSFVRGADDNERMTRQSVFMTRLRWYELRVRQVRRQPMSKRVEWVSTNVARRWRSLFEARTNGGGEVRPNHGQVSHDDQTKELASALRTQIAAGPGSGVLLMQERAASVYFGGHFHGAIDLIWANERPHVRRIDPTRGWGHHADEVRVHQILSTHLGLVTNDLPKLAEEMKAVLDREGE